MNTVVFFLLIIISVFQFVELIFMVQEIRHKPSYSLIYRLLTSYRNSSWLKRLSIDYDIPQIGIHSVLIIIVASILVFSINRSNSIWLCYQIFVLMSALAILLIDQLFWVGSSVLLYFQALQGRLFYLKAKRSTHKTSIVKSNAEINQLKLQVERFTISKYIPRFILKFFAVIMITLFTFSIVYYSIELIYPSSFQSSSSAVITYLDLLYHSIFITTALGSDIEPKTILARSVSSLHGFVNLYLLVLVISFFTSASESEIIIEKSKLVELINISLLEDGDRSNH